MQENLEGLNFVQTHAGPVFALGRSQQNIFKELYMKHVFAPLPACIGCIRQALFLARKHCTCKAKTKGWLASGQRPHHHYYFLGKWKGMGNGLPWVLSPWSLSTSAPKPPWSRCTKYAPPRVWGQGRARVTFWGTGALHPKPSRQSHELHSRVFRSLPHGVNRSQDVPMKLCRVTGNDYITVIFLLELISALHYILFSAKVFRLK